MFMTYKSVYLHNSNCANTQVCLHKNIVKIFYSHPNMETNIGFCNNSSSHNFTMRLQLLKAYYNEWQ